MVAGGTPKSDHHPHGAPPRGAAPAGLPWLDGVAPHSDAHRGYLDAAVARCRLPIQVLVGNPRDEWGGADFAIIDKARGVLMTATGAADATDNYFAMCDALSAPDTSDASPATGAHSAAEGVA